MRHTFFFLYFVFVLVGCQLTLTPEEKGLSVITQTKVKKYIDFLASDELAGRGANTPGGRAAGEYLISNLKKIGVLPWGDCYYQLFLSEEIREEHKTIISPDGNTIDFIMPKPNFDIPVVNVIGQIEGKKKEEYVIVGAHYDHLGEDSTLVGDQIYNGADDNASGVAGVLQIAEAFVATGIKPERTVIFALWDAEEKGLIGSTYFVQNFPHKQNIRTYFNLDMIGRSGDDNYPERVYYIYSDTTTVYGEWLKEDIATYNLQLIPLMDFSAYSFGLISDQYPFDISGIDYNLFFSGKHPDYHKVTDTADKIDLNKVVDITKATFLTLFRLAMEE